MVAELDAVDVGVRLQPAACGGEEGVRAGGWGLWEGLRGRW